MDQSSASELFWRTAALVLWLYLFLVGFFPDSFFEHFRMLGAVRTQNALVNSEYMITLGLSVFLGVYAYRRSQEAGLSQTVARAHGIQLGLIGLLAFLPLERRLGLLPEVDTVGRYLVLFAIVSKMLAWCYLLSIVARAHLWGGLRVFRRMNSLFPRVQAELHGQPKPVQKQSGEDAPSKGDESAYL